MSNDSATSDVFDLLVVGGGINGCGIARDAAGRGLSVALAEMNDLASATSSASTKLFHGGLRYLEYLEFNLVRHALREREVLLRAMPHISWPMRFVLPFSPDMRFDSNTPVSRILNLLMPWLKGRRPSWIIRFGLFLYDLLGGRELLPSTRSLDLRGTKEGEPLKERFQKAYEYSDCWIEDSRLVVLNAQDAENRGAHIMVRTKVEKAVRSSDAWEITLRNTQTNDERAIKARMLVNAGGPWVGDIIHQRANIRSNEGVRLVRGSHIVTKRLYGHDKCYFFQGADGRIIFAIPYETDFTLIGTTDQEHKNPDVTPECTVAEQQYLVDFANTYFKRDISLDDIVWTYSGMRPLYDDGASSATAATRNYTLKVDAADGAPILNIFGGKITTYRKLAEDAMDKIIPFFPGTSGHWTAGVALPGGDFAVEGVDGLISRLMQDYPFLSPLWARRLVRAYGTLSWDVLGHAESQADLGLEFGATLTEREVLWLVRREYARTADDVVWRRSKLGLRLTGDEIQGLESWMQTYHDPAKTLSSAMRGEQA